MKRHYLLTSLDEYRDLHDKDWLSRFFAAVDNTWLSDVALHFAGNWYGAARSFVLPWALIKTVCGFADQVAPGRFSESELWQAYMDRNEFKAALGKNTENCYIAIYCAYEDYVVSVLKLKSGLGHLRVSDRDFANTMRSVVGSTVTQQCWHDNRIDVAREIRHCIVHNGGRPTSRLLRKTPLPRIEDDSVLISSHDLRALYALLADCTMAFTLAAKGVGKAKDVC